jgi:hypothetical protein
MTKVLAIAQREIAERVFVFAAAAAFAVGPLLVFITPAQRPRELAAAIDIWITIAFVLGLGVLLGVSLIGREAREQRLSFYFAQPVSGRAVWWGKLLGGVALIVGVTAIDFALPLLYWPDTHNLFSYSTVMAFLIVASVALMLIVNTIAGMVRSRSALIAADLAAFFLFIAIAAFIVVPFFLDGAVFLPRFLGYSILGATLLVLAFAGAWQLERGRVDVRRAHRELSRFVWGSLAIVLAIAGAYAVWVRAADPWDRANFVSVHGGPLAIVNDPAFFHRDASSPYRLDYQPVFIVNRTNHTYVRANRFVMLHGMHFNNPGTAVGWPEPRFDFGRLRFVPETLRVARLVDGKPRVTDTGLAWSRGQQFALSPDGGRIAIAAEGDRLVVHDVVANHILAVTRMPRAAAPDMISADVVRLYADDAQRLIAFDFDVRTHAMRKSIDLPKPSEKARFITWAPHDAEHAAVSLGDGHVELLDLRTGAYARAGRMR